MTGDLVSAAFASSLLSEGKTPKSVIQYLPPGEHEITAKVNGERATISVIVEAGIERAFQNDLEQHQKENVTPFIDYLHDGGRASGHPKRFSWDDDRGLVLEVDWTPNGATAIASRELQYFSPQFLVGEDGRPIGLHPKEKAIGGLVSDPAFTSIESIAAMRAAINTTETTETPMDLTKFVEQKVITAEQAKDPEKALSIIASHVEASRSQSKDDAAKAAVVKAQKEAADARAEVQKMREDAADAFVAAGVQAGRIKAKDEEAKADLRAMHIEDSVKAQRFLDRMAPVNEGLTQPIERVAAGREDRGNQPTEEENLDQQCRDLIKAGKAKSYSDAFRQIGSDKGYQAYCDSVGIGLAAAQARRQGLDNLIAAHNSNH